MPAIGEAIHRHSDISILPFSRISSTPNLVLDQLSTSKQVDFCTILVRCFSFHFQKAVREYTFNGCVKGKIISLLGSSVSAMRRPRLDVNAFYQRLASDLEFVLAQV